MKHNDKYNETEQKIFDSFFYLCKEYGFEEISTSSIIDNANVSRNAFYSHYKNKYILLSEIIDNLLDGLLNKLDLYLNSKSSIQPLNTYYQEFIEYIETKNSIFNLILFDDYVRNTFIGKSTTLLMKYFSETKKDKDEQKFLSIIIAVIFLINVEIVLRNIRKNLNANNIRIFRKMFVEIDFLINQHSNL
jgi:AcrR family transcriptional regulator